MLLLTDRPTDGRRLQLVLDAVEPCILIGPGQGVVASGDHRLIVCDAARDDLVALALFRAVLAHHRVDPAIPVLWLARDPGPGATAQAEAAGATAVLPRAVSDAQILFTAKQMIAASRSLARTLNPASLAATRDVGMAFGEVFEGARRGRPVPPATLERGAAAVMTAVAGGHIGVWLDVVRNYDDATYQHCLLVAGLSAGFAARIGLTVRGQRLVAQAALVHDIGKAAIPQAILNKPGPLTSNEMDVMRTHAAIGHDLLLRQGGFHPRIVDIVRHHHEYVDGSGYPDALKGEQVSPLVRLVTICDIYAALIERRSYKAPKSTRDALDILAGMGGKLDAGLLRAFGDFVGRGPSTGGRAASGDG